MAKKGDSKGRDKKDRGQTSGAASSDRHDDKTTPAKNPQSVSVSSVTDVDFSTSPTEFGIGGLDLSDATPVSELKGSRSGGLNFSGTGRDTEDTDTQALTSALDAMQFENDILAGQLEQVVFDFNNLSQQNDMLNSMVSAGGAPNPEMGGSAQRRSQQDLIDTPEFDRFNDEVRGEPSFLDRVVDFILPVSTTPATDQETGLFGFESKFHPEKLSTATNILSEITGIDPSIDLGFTSATDVVNRRRDDGETSGAKSSDRRDERKSSTSSNDKIDESSKEDEEEQISLIPDDFLDFPFRDVAPLLMPQFALLGNPDFIKRFQKDKDDNNG